MSLKTWIVKKFVPDAKTIADMVASTVANGVNQLPEKKQQNVAKYSKIAKEVSVTCDKLVGMLTDGTIEKTEQADLSAMLEPIVKKLIDLL